MTAARRPESQEQILEAAVASLAEADIPPDDQDGWLDPDTGRPPSWPRCPTRSWKNCWLPRRRGRRRRRGR